MVGILIIFPHIPGFLREKRRGKQRHPGRELGCLPLSLFLSYILFEILFMSCRVLRLGGTEYTVEGEQDVTCNLNLGEVGI